jgi:penicillin-binding protein 2
MPSPAPRAFFPIKPQALEPVRDGLWQAVNTGGTAKAARIDGYDVVGKTGTAQVISTEGAKTAAKSAGHLNLKDNSWFVFYAPREHPEIAGVVFAEHAGWGATGATPIARYVLETYFAKKEGRPLPTWPTIKAIAVSDAQAKPPAAGPGTPPIKK